MKKLLLKGLSFFIVAVLCLSLLPITAFASNGDFDINENGVLVKYEGKGGHVVIPNNVTSIGDYAFTGTGDLTGITIPNSVTSIGREAFSYCTKLAGITIPNSVTSIDLEAFKYCRGLTSIVIPNSLTSIANLFYGCENLKSVTIPNSVTNISGAFHECRSLTNIKIPDSVTVIGDGAFYECRGLKDIVIPDSVTAINVGAFAYCMGLTSITIPDSVTTIAGSAFYGCENLENVTIPESVTSIGYAAFFRSYFTPSVTIHGVAGTYAETHAKEEGHIFKAIAAPTAKPSNKPSAWAEKDVTMAINYGFVPTYLQTKYTQAATRGEFAALAVTLYEKITGMEITGRKAFSDTTDINVEKAAAIGVVEGVGDSRFNPNAGLTREQAAVMLSRLADETGKPLAQQSPSFTDNSSISSWATIHVGQIQRAGVMGGVGDNKFAPKNAYTREQSIITILRLYEVLK